MYRKRLTTLTVLISVCSLSLAEPKEAEVEGSGVGYGETKSSACEVALNNARREAAQSAYTLVQSNFESMESNTGVKYQQDDIITSKAYARLLNKKESTEYIQDSGQIRCNIKATFKASPIAIENFSETKPKSPAATPNITSQPEQIRQRAIELVAGQPFCLKYFGNYCFREYYDPKIKKWGIQGVGHGISSKQGFGNSSGNQTLMTTIDGVKIDTKEAFINWYENKVDKLPSNIILSGKGEGHKLSKEGYEKNSSDFYIQGLPKVHVGFFTSDSDFDKKHLKEVDQRLRQKLMKQ
jgi:hypothetical protein